MVMFVQGKRGCLLNAGGFCRSIESLAVLLKQQDARPPVNCLGHGPDFEDSFGSHRVHSIRGVALAVTIRFVMGMDPCF